MALGFEGGAFVVDLEWNRKTIFEKLDWLKETLEDVIAKANQNIAFQKEQLQTIVDRLSALEKSERKSIPATTAKRKKPQCVPFQRTKRSSPTKRKR